MTVEIKKSNCFQCWHWCNVDVHLEDGKVVKVLPDKDANPDHKLCIKSSAAVDFHDHESRVNYPLKRVGKRGEDKWEQISWDTAMDEIAGKLADIKKEHGPESVVTMGGTIHSHGDAMAWRWGNLFGTPNLIWLGKNCGEPQVLSDSAIIGQPCSGVAIPGFTRCALVWGNNPADSAPIQSLLGASFVGLKQIKELGGKIIVVDPRRTKTAEIADLWLQIRPGTDGALGLGMIHVIIEEELYDKQFVEEYCLGFDKIKELAAEYTPEKVSEITWIPASDIAAAAIMYATNRPATIGWGVADCHIGGKAVKGAVQTKSILRAITGSIDLIGGNLVSDTPTKMNWVENMMWDKQFDHPDRTRDNLGAETWPIASVKGYKIYREAQAKVYPDGFGGAQYNMFVSSHAIWDGVLNENPYPVKALLMQGANPLLTLGNTKTIYNALKSDNLSLIVSMDFIMTPTNMLADYILPATGWLEKPEVKDFWGFADLIAGADAVVPPMYERHHDYDLWRDLGKRLGQEEYWPDTLCGMYDKLLSASDTTFKELLTMPGRSLPFDIPEEKKYEKRGFGTFSGKVELVPSLFEKLGCDPLPTYEEPPRSPVSTPELAEDYPFILICGSRVINYQHTRYREQQKLRKGYPKPLVKMHPDTAGNLGIRKGDAVYIETPEGRVKQYADVWDGIHPEVIQADAHWFYPELPGKDPCLFGVWESNINAIVPDGKEYFDFAGDNYFRALLCKIYKAEE